MHVSIIRRFALLLLIVVATPVGAHAYEISDMKKGFSKYAEDPSNKYGFDASNEKLGLKKKVTVTVDWDSFPAGFCAMYPKNPGFLCGGTGAVAARLDEVQQLVRMTAKAKGPTTIDSKLKSIHFRADPSISEYAVTCAKPGEFDYAIPANDKARFSQGQKDFDAHKAIFDTCVK